MTVLRSKKFLKQYTQLPASLQKKVDRCLRLLVKNRRHPSIQARKMVNHDTIWEARVDLHTRITFQVSKDQITLRAVGTHEIYRKP